jgi:hypothetical protein
MAMITPLCLFAPTLLVRTTDNTARMPRHHAATRGDADHERGVCLLTTPEVCLVPFSSLHRLVPDIITASHTWIICRLGGSLPSASQPCLLKTFLTCNLF